MSTGKTDQIKGRAKEAVGALIDDPKLKREGRLDQKVGQAKEVAEKVLDKARAAVK